MDIHCVIDAFIIIEDSLTKLVVCSHVLGHPLLSFMSFICTVWHYT